MNSDNFCFHTFRVEYKKMLGGKYTMEGRVITAKMIAGFREHLILEERSVATIQKYIRDVKAFMAYAQNSAITKETVILR